jgi:hypothetical protein
VRDGDGCVAWLAEAGGGSYEEEEEEEEEGAKDPGCSVPSTQWGMLIPNDSKQSRSPRGA